MNSFQTIDTYYLRSSRTIETILLKNKDKVKVLYVYNYEGWFFRVFNNIIDLLDFIEDKLETKIYIDDDEELERYFKKYKL